VLGAAVASLPSLSRTSEPSLPRAAVAPMVEHLPRKQGVAGSTPARGTSAGVAQG
jgi:hypothetical protein